MKRAPAKRTPPHVKPWHRLSRPRLTIGILIGVVVYALLAFTDWRMRVRLITAWDAGVTVAMLAILFGLRTVTLNTIKRNALRQDAGKWAVLALILLAAIASLVVIASEMPLVKASHGLEQALGVVFVLYTIVASWAFIHVVFALHYAHEYYLDVDTEAPKLSTSGQRLAFPGTHMPRYGDFMYFSFTIGMTFQVSDVQIVDPALRQLALLHAVTSFLYSTGIVALTINLVAGLI